MPPVVAEVVMVHQLRSHTRHDVREPLTAFVNHLALIKIIIRIGHAVDPFIYRELVEMTVLPVHDDLQNRVQLGEGDVFPDLYPSPNGAVCISCSVILIW